jgi:hypothetical protein
MELQFETPRSSRFAVLFVVSVILAIALWPLMEHVLNVVSPALASGSSAEASSWDIRAM